MGEVTEKSIFATKVTKGIHSNNKDFKFKTLTADDGYIITNTANGFNVDNYIGTKTIIMPLNKNIDNLIAITEKEHNKYMELVEDNMDKELTKIRDNNG